MSNRNLRVVLRWIHLIGAGAIGTFVYSPYGDDPIFRAAMQFIVIPVLSLTGIALWQQARLNKLLKRGGAKTSAAGA